MVAGVCDDGGGEDEEVLKDVVGDVEAYQV